MLSKAAQCDCSSHVTLGAKHEVKYKQLASRVSMQAAVRLCTFMAECRHAAAYLHHKLPGILANSNARSITFRFHGLNKHISCISLAMQRVLHCIQTMEQGELNATGTGTFCDTGYKTATKAMLVCASRITHNASIQSQQAVLANICPSFCHERPGIALLLNHDQLCWTTDN